MSIKNVLVGRYLSGALLVLSVLTQSGVTRENSMGFREAVDLLNRFSWRLMANRTISQAKPGAWYAASEYNESIFNVIGEAMVDCIYHRNEFKNKNKDDVITFEVEPTADWAPEEWNALVLYNLLHVIYHKMVGDESKAILVPSVEERNDVVYNMCQHFNTVKSRIEDKYSDIDGIAGYIEKAIKDIKAYVSELNIVEGFYWLVYDSQTWRGRAEQDWKTFKDKIFKRVTPTVSIKLNDSTARKVYAFLQSEKADDVKNENDVNVKELQLEEWGYFFSPEEKEDAPYMIIPMNGICYYYDDNYKISINPANSADKIIEVSFGDPKEWTEFDGKSRRTIYNLDQNVQNELLIVANYLANWKLPAGVESIFYDQKSGWVIKYKQ